MTLFEAMVVRVCSKGDLKTLQFVHSTLSAPRSLEEMMAGRRPVEFTEEEAARFRETPLEGVEYRHLGLGSTRPTMAWSAEMASRTGSRPGPSQPGLNWIVCDNFAGFTAHSLGTARIFA